MQACRLCWACWLGCLAGNACSEARQPDPIACDQGTLCSDSDCDTICDFDEGADQLRDTDGDGTPDFQDGDSDDDGIRDREEAGDDDRATQPFDRDQNGVPDYLDPLYPLHPHHRMGADAGMTSLPTAASDASTPGARATCAAASMIGGGCTSDERGDMACDGLDNDCDGRIDGDPRDPRDPRDPACACKRGTVRSCFGGPPARRDVGACQSGMQRCVGEDLPSWGPCEGSVEPTPEICDGLDNDCDGCTDELSTCASALSCPAPGDPRVPDARPFVTYTLDAARFYAAPDAQGYHWYISGSPCDRLFRSSDPSATEQSGKQSFVLYEPSRAQTEVLFTLSGSYAVTLVVDTPSGSLRCDFALRVRAPGLRVELCWDKTGPSAAMHDAAVDLDLHLGLATDSFATPNDCHGRTCRGEKSPWGENINLEDPHPDDRFRIAVQYNENISSDANDADAGTSANISTRALVDVYCDGVLRGSFGGDPENSQDSEQLTLSKKGELWRVADILVTDTDCELQPLSDPSRPGHYWISHDSSYGGP